MMTKKWMLLLVTAAFTLLLSACNTGGSGDVVVETNAGDITKDEFYEELKSKYGEEVLREMVEAKLLAEAVEVDKDEVDEKIAKIKENFNTDEEFEAALASSPYKTEEDLRKVIENDLKLFKYATRDVEVSDEKLTAYFNEFVKREEVRASHILVEDEEQAKELLDLIKNGADFAELAKEHSTDSGSAVKGGDLDFFTRGKMVPEFEKEAFSLEVGEVSDLVKSQFGYHIIKVTDVKLTEKTLEDNKEEIREMYLSANAESSEDVLKKLIEDGDIKVLDKDLKDIFEQ
jgi:foldase protein PrsA